jgi:hypothetical protein
VDVYLIFSDDRTAKPAEFAECYAQVRSQPVVQGAHENDPRVRVAHSARPRKRLVRITAPTRLPHTIGI